MSQTKHPGGRPRRTDGARQTTIHLSAEAHALAVALAKERTRGNLSASVEKLIREAAGTEYHATVKE